ncbi:hypothetical protein [Sphingomonas sp. TX0522]|uniref:hypothetical protein n=1 Tax=Sphingomonas sp. TX0522 TaxID=2479205 RepID=UPI0018E01FA6|nr:hypothetical protein [Sphingomonas sp. TX0522]MBI0533057.1 hypothetical protein [Sphingomonas sp. TX0522]
MTFSYTLVLALLLLFPGLCAFAGLRAGERTDFLAPRPEKPNSTSTLFIVVAGTIVGHILGAGVFAAQAAWCRLTGLCVNIGYDPNVYRVLLASQHPAGGLTDGAIEWWIFFLGALGAGTGWFFSVAARSTAFKGTFDPIDFGWLNPAVQAVKAGNSVVVAYVVSKTSHNGTSIAYEGIVDRLALDDDQKVAMVVLSRVDRFTVRIEEDGSVRRHEGGGAPIPQMQFAASEIANIAFEVLTEPTEGERA